MARKRTSARKFGGNVASVVTDKNNLRDLGYMALGSTLYAIVPTAISRFFKVDLSGIKGVLVGLGAGLVSAGFGGGGFAVFAGTVGAFFGHLWWTHLNGTVAYPIFGQYLWRWDPTAKTLGMQTAPQSFSDQVGNVQTVRLPNGKTVPVYSKAPRNLLPESRQNGLQDYTTTLRDYSTTLRDYTPGMTADRSNQVADYAQDLSQSLADPMANQEQDHYQYEGMM